MSTTAPNTARCVAEGCPNTYKTHRWGAIKSQSDGWFHQREGQSWCPDHVPAWVANWRAKRVGMGATS